VSGRWLEFMDFLLQQSEARARLIFLKDAAPIREETEKIVLGLKTGLSVARAEKEVADPEVQQQLRQFFGRPMTVQCVQLSDDTAAGQSYLGRESEKERGRLDEIKRNELSHPRVKLAASLFGVDAGEIRVEVDKIK
jgi:hypothetical protein